MSAGITWHANTSESSAFVNASALVHARVGLALIDIHFAPGSGEPWRAVTTV